MKSIKTSQVLLAAAIFLFALIGSTEGASARPAKKAKKVAQTVRWQDGEWTGTGSGYMGTVKVKVKVANGAIAKIDILSNEDTPQYFNKAKASVPAQIIKKQSTEVDGATGATYSSQGISDAVANALAKAKKK